jgi:hypothetical protein
LPEDHAHVNFLTGSKTQAPLFGRAKFLATLVIFKSIFLAANFVPPRKLLKPLRKDSVEHLDSQKDQQVVKDICRSFGSYSRPKNRPIQEVTVSDNRVRLLT